MHFPRLGDERNPGIIAGAGVRRHWVAKTVQAVPKDGVRTYLNMTGKDAVDRVVKYTVLIDINGNLVGA